MADVDEGVVPSEAEGSANIASGGALSFLDPDWINERVLNVIEKAFPMLFDRIIDRGLLINGYGPFSTPVTDDMILKMTPGQLEAFLSTIPSEQEKAEILKVVTDLKMPGKVALPTQSETSSPAPKPKLAFGPEDRLNLQGES